MALVTYTRTGPFTNGAAPGISAAFLNAMETFLTATGAMWDSNASWDGNGLLTLVSLAFSGAGKIVMPSPSAQSLSTGNTITIPGPFIKVTTSGNVTGIIMATGSTTNQVALLYQSSSAGTVTFAASGSNVRNGSNVILNVGRLYLAIWDGSNWAFGPN